MLYLVVVLDENLLDKQQVCDVILKKSKIWLYPQMRIGVASLQNSAAPKCSLLCWAKQICCFFRDRTWNLRDLCLFNSSFAPYQLFFSGEGEEKERCFTQVILLFREEELQM